MKRFDKKCSFIIVTLVYLSAIAIGLLMHLSLDTLPFYWALFIADLIATGWVFIFSSFLSNASVYDPYWSVKPVVVLIAFSIGKSLGLYQIVLLVVVTLWGVRLTANWAYTFGDLSHEDWRYRQIKANTGRLYPFINLLGIHIVPTIVTYAVTLPAVFVINLPDIGGNVWSYLCLAVSTVAFCMQGLADVQMHKYRKNRKGNFIRSGLWKYSRHPNYLGEILMWWGVGLSCCIYLGIWYLIIGAVLNTLLFLFISIPLADKRQSRKEGYDEYRKQTWSLLPIPRFKK